MKEAHPVWDLVERSIIVQSIVTLGFVATVWYLYATGEAVPPTLQHTTELLIGFWMGSKVTHAQVRHYESRKQGTL